MPKHDYKDSNARARETLAPLATPHSPGYAAAVIVDGVCIFEDFAGLASLSQQTPITADSVFPLGSITKTMVATLVHMLECEGKLSTGAGVNHYLPEFANMADITLQNLLDMQSGLPEIYTLMQLMGENGYGDYTHADACAYYAGIKTRCYCPGQLVQYCNANFMILARVLEVVTGQSYEKLLQNRIFKPLKMDSAGSYANPGSVILNGVECYEKDDSGTYVTGGPWHPNRGAGDCHARLEDVVKWMLFLLDAQQGDHALPSFITKRGRLADGTAMNYGNGFVHLEHRGMDFTGHTGSWAGLKTFFFLNHERRFACIMLSNHGGMDFYKTATELADIYLDAHMEPGPQMTRESDYSHLNGAYIDEASGDFLRLEWQHPDLIADYNNQDGLALTPRGGGRFVRDTGFMRISLHQSDEARLSMQVNGLHHDFRYISDAPLPHNDELCGVYENADLGIVHEIYTEEKEGSKTLKLRAGGEFNTSRAMTLTPKAPDIFLATLAIRGQENGLILAFRRNKHGAVTSYVVQQDRVRDLEFGRVE